MKTNTLFRSLTFAIATTAALLPSAINTSLAQSPSPIVAVPFPNGYSWHKLSVKYITPQDILTTLHWNDFTRLPMGVTKIYPLEDDSSLFIQSTPDGFSKVKDALKTLDVESPIVQIKVEYARVPLSEVQAFGIKFTTFPFPVTVYQMEHRIDSSFWPPNTTQTASGEKVAGLLSHLMKNSTPLVQLPFVSAYNNVTTMVNVSPSDFSEVSILPHIHENQTIQIDLTLTVNEYLPSFQNGPVPTQQVTVKDTVFNGKPILLAGLEMDGQTDFLVFITPTLLPDTPADSTTIRTPSEGASQ